MCASSDAFEPWSRVPNVLSPPHRTSSLAYQLLQLSKQELKHGLMQSVNLNPTECGQVTVTKVLSSLSLWYAPVFHNFSTAFTAYQVTLKSNEGAAYSLHNLSLNRTLWWNLAKIGVFLYTSCNFVVMIFVIKYLKLSHDYCSKNRSLKRTHTWLKAVTTLPANPKPNWCFKASSDLRTEMSFSFDRLAHGIN